MQPSSPTRRSATLRALPAHATHGFAKAPLALAAQVLIAASSIAMLGWAPQATAQSATQNAASAIREYNIPAGPLSTLLTRLSVESGLRLAGASAEAQGVQSPGVQGRHSASSALAAALAGTNVEAVPQGDGSYLLRQVATLPEVTVTAPGGRGGVATLPEVVVTATVPGITEGTGSYTSDSTNTATGLDLSLRQTPQSVSVITRQRMDDQGMNTVNAALEQTTGIYVWGDSSLIGNRTEAYSRGFYIANYQIDGVSTSQFSVGPGAVGDSDGQANAAIYDSVVVVRGATGLMTGAGNPGGTFNLVRKRPTQDFQGYIEAGLGRWDQRSLTADLGGPLNAAGTLRGRFVGAFNESKSWVKPYEDDTSVLYGVLEADLSDRTLLSLSLEHGRENSEGRPWTSSGLPVVFADGSPTPFGRYDSGTPAWADWNNRRTTLTTKLEHQLNEDWRAELSYSYNRASNDTKQGFISSYYIHPESSANGPFTATGQLLDRKSNVHTLNAKLNGKYQLWGRQHQLVAGINSHATTIDGKHEYRTNFENAVDWVNGRLQWISEPDWTSLSNAAPYKTDTDQTGAWLATQLQLTDRLSLIGGGRWTQWKTRLQYFPGSSGYKGEGSSTVSDDRKESAFTPYAGLVFDITKNISAYASYTDIFEPQSSYDVNDKLLDPKVGANYELGAKGEWLGGRLNGSIAIFQSKQDNLGVLLYDSSGNFVWTSGGNIAYEAKDNVKTRGWEVELAGELTPGWQWQAGYSRTVKRDNDGERLTTDIPVHLLKLFTTYTPKSLPRLTLGGGVNWQSERYLTSGDSYGLRDLYTQDSFALVNLMARYAVNDQLSLAVRVNNALNKDYKTSLGGHDRGALRNVSATLKYQF